MLQTGDEHPSEDILVTHEGGTTVILLTNESPEIFARFNIFLYSGRFLNREEHLADMAWEHVVNVYLFSVRKGITQLHNKCIDAAIIKTNKGGLFPSQDTINSLYNLVDAPASPLRRLMIKLFARRCDLKSAILGNSNYHQTFLNGLVVELYETAKGVKAEDLDIWMTRREYYATDFSNPIALE